MERPIFNMADNVSVYSELTLATTETAEESEQQPLPLLSALRENSVNGAPYTPVESEQPMMVRFMEHADPQVRLQSGLVRFGYRDKKQVSFMLDFVPKILRNKENWVRFPKTWKKICKVQAWNLYHLVKFVWSDVFTTTHQLPHGLTHDQMHEFLDMCNYADEFKTPLKVTDRTRLESMLKELDFNQRSIKAYETFVHKKALEIRVAKERRKRVEMEARRQRCLELEQQARRQREQWERQLRESEQFERNERATLSVEQVRRRLEF